MEEQTYLDMMDNAARWNTLLLRDRSGRLPFFDAQTGVDQIDCRHLWHKESERFPGQRLDQVFSYPTARWKWVRRPKVFPSDEAIAAAIAADATNGFDTSASVKAAGTEAGKSTAVDWQSDLDFFQVDDDIPEPEDDFDDDYYEEGYKKRRRKAGVSPSAGAYGSRRSGRRQPTEEDALKPFVCETCGLGYKTKPGLHYHLMKAHPVGATAAPIATVELSKPAERPANSRPSNICDVCHCETLLNAKSGQPEELIGCSDCGKSGHPTCLQFTENMVLSVKKYKWQCIDCKACAVCGTSENDDQLLFCDDCDRGYHMYCLDPPISEPPEGSWSCRLCIAEFHVNASSFKSAADKPPSSSNQGADTAPDVPVSAAESDNKLPDAPPPPTLSSATLEQTVEKEEIQQLQTDTGSTS